MHKTVVEQEAVACTCTHSDLRIATYRRGAGVFFRDFGEYLAKLNVKEVVSMCQSESDGNITLTIAYR